MPLGPENPIPHSPEEARGLSVRFVDGVSRFSSMVGVVGDHAATASFYAMVLAIHPRDVVRAVRKDGLRVFPPAYREFFDNMQPILHLGRHPNYPNF